MNWFREQKYIILANLLALIPLFWIAGDFIFGRLSADPIREVQLLTGRYALILLIISLACTPFYRVLRWKFFLQLRRLSGLYAFGYASWHLLNFLGVDYGFNLTALQQDALGKRYVLVGLAAYVCLIPMVITSTKGWQRKLGNNWNRIHRLTYIVAILSIVHFIWLSKIDIMIPLIYGGIVVILLIVRLPFIYRNIDRRKNTQNIDLK